MPELTQAQVDLAAVHHHLAQHAALEARRRWPMTDRDELLSDAYFGLVDAAQRYQPGRGATFATFAKPRIWGAMIDGYRARNGRHGQHVHQPYPTDDEGQVIERHLADDEFGYERVEDRLDAVTLVAALVPTLRMRDRFVLAEMGDGATLAEVGSRLGVTESRACQLVAQVKAGPTHRSGMCDTCSRRFRPRNSRSRYCSPACKQQARVLARRKSRQPRLCGWCRVSFRPFQPSAQFCTGRCRQAAWAAARRAA